MQHSLLAIILARRDDLAGGARHLEEAKEIYRKVGRLTQQPFLLLAEADLARKQGQWERVISGLEEAVELFSQYGMRWYRAFTLLQLADEIRAGIRESQLGSYRFLLEEAGSEFATIGAPIYAEEALARLRRAR